MKRLLITQNSALACTLFSSWIILALPGCSSVSEDSPGGDPAGSGGAIVGAGGSGGASWASGGMTSGIGGDSLSSGGLSSSGGASSTGGVATGGTLTTSGGAQSTGGQPTGGVPGAGGSDSDGSGGDNPGGTGGETSAGGMTGSGGMAQSAGSAGCGKTTARPDPRQQQTIQVGNLTRYYLMYVPENYDAEKPLPLVFAIHGLNMNNVWAAHDSSGFELIENTNDEALLIYPQGIQAGGQSAPPSSQSQWGDADSNWGGPPPNANADRLNADLNYFDAMLEFASENYCVDRDRVFAMGFSQGGFMTNALGCERSDVFKALAPVAGWGPWGSNPSCNNADAAHAVIQTQGDTDGTVTPQLGQATRDFWLARAGCSGMTMPSSFGQGCVEYQGCDDGKPVIYCTHGGDHFVPGGAGPRAWEFFKSLD